jgi:hypothetical protein
VCVCVVALVTGRLLCVPLALQQISLCITIALGRRMEDGVGQTDRSITAWCWVQAISCWMQRASCSGTRYALPPPQTISSQ